MLPVTRMTCEVHGRSPLWPSGFHRRRCAAYFSATVLPRSDTEFIDTLISEVIECPILEVFG